MPAREQDCGEGKARSRANVIDLLVVIEPLSDVDLAAEIEEIEREV